MSARDALAVARGHPRHLVLFALVAGLLCGGWAPLLAAPVALAALLVAGRSGLAAAAVVAVLGGAVLADARRQSIDTGRLPAELGASVNLRLTLLEPLHERGSGEVVGRSRLAGGEALLLRAPNRASIPDGVGPGDVLAVSGRLVELKRFDRIQRRRGAIAGVEVSELRATGQRRGGLSGALDAVRRRAEAGLAAGLPRAQSALLAGMVLGRDDEIGAPTREAFQASGLAHLLAVSGTNVLLLATLAIWAAGLFGVPLRTRLAAALVLVALYVPLTGAGPSIQRAGVMGAAGLVAALAGRPASRVYALGLAAAVTLALNPYAAGDAGWQLSFAAVVGLLAIAVPLREHLARRRVPGPVADAAAMTLAATVATAPLLAVHFERLSLVSLPANLIVAPVVAPIMWLGMLAAAVAQASPALAVPLNAVNAPLVAFVDRVAAGAAGLPHAVVDFRLPGLPGALLGYAALAAVWLAVRRVPRGPRLALGAAVTAAALLSAVAAARDGPSAPGPGETVVSFLDVGQGDATLVQRDGRSILFDTGPPQGRVVERVREVGVDRLDALVITHAQLDHEGATVPVLEHLRPRLVVDGGAGWPTPVQRVLPHLAAEVGARVVTAAAGDELRLGAMRIEVLSPSKEIQRLPPSGDPNQRAMVTHLRSGGFDLLLTADAETDVTAALALPRAEVLKVAHHGSVDPGLPAQLERVQPLVAGIEVGRHNTYGHPAPATLAALRVVPRVFRTDRDGTVRLYAKGGDLRVERLAHR